MLKEITFYADFGKRDGVTHKKKKQNLRKIFHGTQKKKKTVKTKQERNLPWQE
jgi:hypothetical protein